MFVEIPIHTDNSNILLIFVPGLLETADTPLFVRTAHMFSESGGFATVRIDSPSFYGSAGELEETSIYAQAQDIAVVVSYFRQTFDRIVLVAHSLGAFASFLSTNSVELDCIILWDPSLHPFQIFAPTLCDASQTDFCDIYLKQRLSPVLIEELSLLPEIGSIASKVTCPVGIISAERGAVCIVDSYALCLPILLGHTVIHDADHNFSTPQHMINLTNATIKLIKKAAQKSGGQDISLRGQEEFT